MWFICLRLGDPVCNVVWKSKCSSDALKTLFIINYLLKFSNKRDARALSRSTWASAEEDSMVIHCRTMHDIVTLMDYHPVYYLIIVPCCYYTIWIIICNTFININFRKSVSAIWPVPSRNRGSSMDINWANLFYFPFSIVHQLINIFYFLELKWNKIFYKFQINHYQLGIVFYLSDQHLYKWFFHFTNQLSELNHLLTNVTSITLNCELSNLLLSKCLIFA